MSDDYPIEGVPTPDPADGPAAVVERQLAALSTNDDPFENAGIATAYNLASPGNRANTGPFPRFVRMVTGPTYAPMVDHVEAVTGPLERDGERATQRVTLTGPDGRTVTYEFGLSVWDEPAAGCWLTDSVLAD
jgi:hypothetical protein